MRLARRLCAVLALVVLACTMCGSRAVNGVGVGAGTVATTPLGVTQTGTGLASLSTANYLTVTGSGPDANANTGGAALFDWDGSTSSATLWSYTDGSTRGWALGIASGVLQITWYPSTTWSIGSALSAGTHSVSWTWDATTTNLLRAFLDTPTTASLQSGGNLATHALPGSYTSPNASSLHRVGLSATGTGAWPATVWALKHYGRVLSDAEMATFAGHGWDTGWWGLPGALSGDASCDLDFAPGRDWNGLASTVTSQGTSPVTWSVVGAPTLSTVQDTFISLATAAGQALLWNSPLGTEYPISTPATYQQNPYARFVFQTSDAAIYACSDPVGAGPAYVFTQTGTPPWGNGVSFVGYVNSEIHAFGGTPPPPSECARFVLPGGLQTVEVWGMESSYVTGVSCVNNTCANNIRAVRVSVGGATRVSPQIGAGAVGWYGDSISCGNDGDPFTPASGYVYLLRNNLRASQIGVTPQCVAAMGLCTDIANVHGSIANIAADLVANVHGAGVRELGLAIGTNDYGLNGCSASTFQTDYSSLLSAIHTSDPAISVIALSPFIRTTETGNSFGNTLDDYRNAISTACSAAGTWCTYVNGKPIVSIGNITGAGVHPNVAGHLQAYTAIRPTVCTPFGCSVAGTRPGSSLVAIGLILVPFFRRRRTPEAANDYSSEEDRRAA